MEEKKSFSPLSDKGNTGLEISARNYEKAAGTLAIIAEEISGLPIPEKTIEEWRSLLASVRIVDNRLDNITEPEQKLEFQNQIIDYLNGGAVDFSSDKELENAMLNVNNLSMSLDKNERQFFHNLLSRILKISGKIRIEKIPQKLVDLRRIEGQITAKIFLPFLPEEFKSSKDYHRLVHALTRLARAANGFDSFIDLPDDYKNGQIEVEPSAFNRVLFLGAVLSDGLSMLKDMKLSKNLIKEFILRTKDVAQNSSEKP